MAGDANTGGGGSVYWSVETNDLENADTLIKRVDGEAFRLCQEGSDKDGDIGADFTVSIKTPQGETSQEFLERLKKELTIDYDRVYFNLSIEDNREQVRVSWGARNPNHRGNGGRPSRTARPPKSATSRKLAKAPARGRKR